MSVDLLVKLLLDKQAPPECIWTLPGTCGILPDNMAYMRVIISSYKLDFNIKISNIKSDPILFAIDWAISLSTKHTRHTDNSWPITSFYPVEVVACFIQK